MATIGIIDNNGQQTEREVFSRTAQIDSDRVGELNPSVIERIKFDNKGQMSRIMTECGEAENRRQGDQKPNLTVEGIIVEDEIGSMRSLQTDEEITFVSDIYSGPVIIERLSIDQKSDLIYIQLDGSGEKELAFRFQMQLKVP